MSQDSFTAAELAPLVAETIFAAHLHCFAELDSTNSAAMREAAAHYGRQANVAGNVEENDVARRPGEVWIAEQQTAGKGRGGHRWESRIGDGLYLSALVRPRVHPTDVLLLSLAAGLAVQAAIQEITGLDADLRWPNDVLLGEHKVCGILTELSTSLERVRYAAIGIGINVHHESFPPALSPLATSLRLATGRDWSRLTLAAAVLRALDRELSVFDSPAAPWRDALLRRFERHCSFCRNVPVTVDEDEGFAGITRGLDAHGFLLVETDRGLRTVLNGGVRKRR